jgi:HK97 gp10 family phage protein
MASYYKWNGNEVSQYILTGVMKNLSTAGGALRDELKRTLSKPGRTITTVATKKGGTRKKYGKKGELVSAPGEPPLKQSGALQRSVKRVVNRKKRTVRVTFKGNLTEFGTVNMKARPSLRPAVDRMRPVMAELAVTELPPPRNT